MNKVGDMLSQEEIDALLKGTSAVAENKPDEALDENEKDALGEIGNISMGTSATTLFTLLGQKVTITTSSGLKEDQIQKMMKDAELHAEEDKRRQEEIEAINEADSLIYTTEKSLKELGEKADQAQVEKVNAVKEELQKAVTAKNISEIKAGKEKLEKALHELSATIYNQAAPGDPGAADAGGTDNYGPEGPTVDADYKVQDDK